MQPQFWHLHLEPFVTIIQSESIRPVGALLTSNLVIKHPIWPFLVAFGLAFLIRWAAIEVYLFREHGFDNPRLYLLLQIFHIFRHLIFAFYSVFFIASCITYLGAARVHGFKIFKHPFLRVEYYVGRDSKCVGYVYTTLCPPCERVRPVKPVVSETVDKVMSSPFFQIDGFQDPASPGAFGIIDFHHDLMFLLTIIVIFVLWLVVQTIWKFYLPDPVYLTLFRQRCSKDPRMYFVIYIVYTVWFHIYLYLRGTPLIRNSGVRFLRYRAEPLFPLTVPVFTEPVIYSLRDWDVPDLEASYVNDASSPDTGLQKPFIDDEAFYTSGREYEIDYVYHSMSHTPVLEIQDGVIDQHSIFLAWSDFPFLPSSIQYFLDEFGLVVLAQMTLIAAFVVCYGIYHRFIKNFGFSFEKYENAFGRYLSDRKRVQGLLNYAFLVMIGVCALLLPFWVDKDADVPGNGAGQGSWRRASQKRMELVVVRLTNSLVKQILGEEDYSLFQKIYKLEKMALLRAYHPLESQFMFRKKFIKNISYRRNIRRAISAEMYLNLIHAHTMAMRRPIFMQYMEPFLWFRFQFLNPDRKMPSPALWRDIMAYWFVNYLEPTITRNGIFDSFLYSAYAFATHPIFNIQYMNTLLNISPIYRTNARLNADGAVKIPIWVHSQIAPAVGHYLNDPNITETERHQRRIFVEEFKERNSPNILIDYGKTLSFEKARKLLFAPVTKSRLIPEIQPSGLSSFVTPRRSSFFGRRLSVIIHNILRPYDKIKDVTIDISSTYKGDPRQVFDPSDELRTLSDIAKRENYYVEVIRSQPSFLRRLFVFRRNTAAEQWQRYRFRILYDNYSKLRLHFDTVLQEQLLLHSKQDFYANQRSDVRIQGFYRRFIPNKHYTTVNGVITPLDQLHPLNGLHYRLGDNNWLLVSPKRYNHDNRETDSFLPSLFAALSPLPAKWSINSVIREKKKRSNSLTGSRYARLALENKYRLLTKYNAIKVPLLKSSWRKDHPRRFFKLNWIYNKLAKIVDEDGRHVLAQYPGVRSIFFRPTAGIHSAQWHRRRRLLLRTPRALRQRLYTHYHNELLTSTDYLAKRTQPRSVPNTNLFSLVRRRIVLNHADPDHVTTLNQDRGFYLLNLRRRLLLQNLKRINLNRYTDSPQLTHVKFAVSDYYRVFVRKQILENRFYYLRHLHDTSSKLLFVRRLKTLVDPNLDPAFVLPSRNDIPQLASGNGLAILNHYWRHSKKRKNLTKGSATFRKFHRSRWLRHRGSHSLFNVGLKKLYSKMRNKHRRYHHLALYRFVVGPFRELDLNNPFLQQTVSRYAVPHPLLFNAFRRRYKTFRLKQKLLKTASIENDFDNSLLDYYGKQRIFMGTPFAAKKLLVQTYAYLGRLHKRRLKHRDFKWRWPSKRALNYAYQTPFFVRYHKALPGHIKSAYLRDMLLTHQRALYDRARRDPLRARYYNIFWRYEAQRRNPIAPKIEQLLAARAALFQKKLGLSSNNQAFVNDVDFLSAPVVKARYDFKKASLIRFLVARDQRESFNCHIPSSMSSTTLTYMRRILRNSLKFRQQGLELDTYNIPSRYSRYFHPARRFRRDYSYSWVKEFLVPIAKVSSSYRNSQYTKEWLEDEILFKDNYREDSVEKLFNLPNFRDLYKTRSDAAKLLRNNPFWAGSRNIVVNNRFHHQTHRSGQLTKRFLAWDRMKIDTDPNYRLVRLYFQPLIYYLLDHWQAFRHWIWRIRHHYGGLRRYLIDYWRRLFFLMEQRALKGRPFWGNSRRRDTYADWSPYDVFSVKEHSSFSRVKQSAVKRRRFYRLLRQFDRRSQSYPALRWIAWRSTHEPVSWHNGPNAEMTTLFNYVWNIETDLDDYMYRWSRDSEMAELQRCAFGNRRALLQNRLERKEHIKRPYDFWSDALRFDQTGWASSNALFNEFDKIQRLRSVQAWQKRNVGWLDAIFFLDRSSRSVFDWISFFRQKILLHFYLKRRPIGYTAHEFLRQDFFDKLKIKRKPIKKKNPKDLWNEWAMNVLRRALIAEPIRKITPFRVSDYKWVLLDYSFEQIYSAIDQLHVENYARDLHHDLEDQWVEMNFFKDATVTDPRRDWVDKHPESFASLSYWPLASYPHELCIGPSVDGGRPPGLRHLLLNRYWFLDRSIKDLTSTISETEARKQFNFQLIQGSRNVFPLVISPSFSVKTPAWHRIQSLATTQMNDRLFLSNLINERLFYSILLEKYERGDVSDGYVSRILRTRARGYTYPILPHISQAYLEGRLKEQLATIPFPRVRPNNYYGIKFFDGHKVYSPLFTNDNIFRQRDYPDFYDGNRQGASFYNTIMADVYGKELTVLNYLTEQNKHIIFSYRNFLDSYLDQRFYRYKRLNVKDYKRTFIPPSSLYLRRFKQFKRLLLNKNRLAHFLRNPMENFVINDWLVRHEKDDSIPDLGSYDFSNNPYVLLYGGPDLDALSEFSYVPHDDIVLFTHSDLFANSKLEDNHQVRRKKVIDYLRAKLALSSALSVFAGSLQRIELALTANHTALIKGGPYLRSLVQKMYESPEQNTQKFANFLKMHRHFMLQKKQDLKAISRLQEHYVHTVIPLMREFFDRRKFVIELIPELRPLSYPPLFSRLHTNADYANGRKNSSFIGGWADELLSRFHIIRATPLTTPDFRLNNFGPLNADSTPNDTYPLLSADRYMPIYSRLFPDFFYERTLSRPALSGSSFPNSLFFGLMPLLPDQDNRFLPQYLQRLIDATIGPELPAYARRNPADEEPFPEPEYTSRSSVDSDEFAAGALGVQANQVQAYSVSDLADWIREPNLSIIREPVADYELTTIGERTDVERISSPVISEDQASVLSPGHYTSMALDAHRMQPYDAAAPAPAPIPTSSSLPDVIVVRHPGDDYSPRPLRSNTYTHDILPDHTHSYSHAVTPSPSFFLPTATTGRTLQDGSFSYVLQRPAPWARPGVQAQFYFDRPAADYQVSSGIERALNRSPDLFVGQYPFRWHFAFTTAQAVEEANTDIRLLNRLLKDEGFLPVPVLPVGIEHYPYSQVISPTWYYSNNEHLKYDDLVKFSDLLLMARDIQRYVKLFTAQYRDEPRPGEYAVEPPALEDVRQAKQQIEVFKRQVGAVHDTFDPRQYIGNRDLFSRVFNLNSQLYRSRFRTRELVDGQERQIMYLARTVSDRLMRVISLNREHFTDLFRIMPSSQGALLRSVPGFIERHETLLESIGDFSDLLESLDFLPLSRREIREAYVTFTRDYSPQHSPDTDRCEVVLRHYLQFISLAESIANRVMPFITMTTSTQPLSDRPEAEIKKYLDAQERQRYFIARCNHLCRAYRWKQPYDLEIAIGDEGSFLNSIRLKFLRTIYEEKVFDNAATVRREALLLYRLLITYATQLRGAVANIVNDYNCSLESLNQPVLEQQKVVGQSLRDPEAALLQHHRRRFAELQKQAHDKYKSYAEVPYTRNLDAVNAEEAAFMPLVKDINQFVHTAEAPAREFYRTKMDTPGVRKYFATKFEWNYFYRPLLEELREDLKKFYRFTNELHKENLRLLRERNVMTQALRRHSIRISDELEFWVDHDEETDTYSVAPELLVEDPDLTESQDHIAEEFEQLHVLRDALADERFDVQEKQQIYLDCLNVCIDLEEAYTEMISYVKDILDGEDYFLDYIDYLEADKKFQIMLAEAQSYYKPILFALKDTLDYYQDQRMRWKEKIDSLYDSDERGGRVEEIIPQTPNAINPTPQREDEAWWADVVYQNFLYQARDLVDFQFLMARHTKLRSLCVKSLLTTMDSYDIFFNYHLKPYNNSFSEHEPYSDRFAYAWELTPIPSSSLSIRDFLNEARGLRRKPRLWGSNRFRPVTNRIYTPITTSFGRSVEEESAALMDEPNYGINSTWEFDYGWTEDNSYFSINYADEGLLVADPNDAAVQVALFELPISRRHALRFDRPFLPKRRRPRVLPRSFFFLTKMATDSPQYFRKYSYIREKQRKPILKRPLFSRYVRRLKRRRQTAIKNKKKRFKRLKDKLKRFAYIKSHSRLLPQPPLKRFRRQWLPRSLQARLRAFRSLKRYRVHLPYRRSNYLNNPLRTRIKLDNYNGLYVPHGHYKRYSELSYSIYHNSLLKRLIDRAGWNPNILGGVSPDNFYDSYFLSSTKKDSFFNTYRRLGLDFSSNRWRDRHSKFGRSRNVRRRAKRTRAHWRTERRKTFFKTRAFLKKMTQDLDGKRSERLNKEELLSLASARELFLRATQRRLFNSRRKQAAHTRMKQRSLFKTLRRNKWLRSTFAYRDAMGHKFYAAQRRRSRRFLQSLKDDSLSDRLSGQMPNELNSTTKKYKMVRVLAKNGLLEIGHLGRDSPHRGDWFNRSGQRSYYNYGGRGFRRFLRYSDFFSHLRARRDRLFFQHLSDRGAQPISPSAAIKLRQAQLLPLFLQSSLTQKSVDTQFYINPALYKAKLHNFRTSRPRFFDNQVPEDQKNNFGVIKTGSFSYLLYQRFKSFLSRIADKLLTARTLIMYPVRCLVHFIFGPKSTRYVPRATNFLAYLHKSRRRKDLRGKPPMPLGIRRYLNQYFYDATGFRFFNGFRKGALTNFSNRQLPFIFMRDLKGWFESNLEPNKSHKGPFAEDEDGTFRLPGERPMNDRVAHEKREARHELFRVQRKNWLSSYFRTVDGKDPYTLYHSWYQDAQSPFLPYLNTDYYYSQDTLRHSREFLQMRRERAEYRRGVNEQYIHALLSTNMIPLLKTVRAGQFARLNVPFLYHTNFLEDAYFSPFVRKETPISVHLNPVQESPSTERPYVPVFRRYNGITLPTFEAFLAQSGSWSRDRTNTGSVRGRYRRALHRISRRSREIQPDVLRTFNYANFFDSDPGAKEVQDVLSSVDADKSLYFFFQELQQLQHKLGSVDHSVVSKLDDSYNDYTAHVIDEIEKLFVEGRVTQAAFLTRQLYNDLNSGFAGANARHRIAFFSRLPKPHKTRERGLSVFYRTKRRFSTADLLHYRLYCLSRLIASSDDHVITAQENSGFRVAPFVNKEASPFWKKIGAGIYINRHIIVPLPAAPDFTKVYFAKLLRKHAKVNYYKVLSNWLRRSPAQRRASDLIQVMRIERARSNHVKALVRGKLRFSSLGMHKSGFIYSKSRESHIDADRELLHSLYMRFLAEQNLLRNLQSYTRRFTGNLDSSFVRRLLRLRRKLTNENPISYVPFAYLLPELERFFSDKSTAGRAQYREIGASRQEVQQQLINQWHEHKHSPFHDIYLKYVSNPDTLLFLNKNSIKRRPFGLDQPVIDNIGLLKQLNPNYNHGSSLPHMVDLIKPESIRFFKYVPKEPSDLLEKAVPEPTMYTLIEGQSFVVQSIFVSIVFVFACFFIIFLRYFSVWAYLRGRPMFKRIWATHFAGRSLRPWRQKNK